MEVPDTTQTIRYVGKCDCAATLEFGWIAGECGAIWTATKLTDLQRSMLCQKDHREMTRLLTGMGGQNEPVR